MTGEEWYYQTAEQVKVEHPDWSMDDITNYMSNLVAQNNAQDWYYQTANQIQAEHSDWSMQQVTNYMTNLINGNPQQPQQGMGDLRESERQSDEERYYNTANQVKAEHPDWSMQQITDYMTNLINGKSSEQPLNGEAWYYQQAQALQIEHPNWTPEQITNKISEIVWNNNYNSLVSDIANSSSPEERDQKIERFRSQLLEFYVSGIDVDNDVTYLRDVQGVDHRYLLTPTNPAFVDATLSFQDMANGYHLEYNSNGILWMVKASGEPHPDDLAKYQEQQEHNQSISDNMVAKASMVFGGSIAGKASQEVSVVTKELNQTEGTLVQGGE